MTTNCVSLVVETIDGRTYAYKYRDELLKALANAKTVQTAGGAWDTVLIGQPSGYELRKILRNTLLSTQQCLVNNYLSHRLARSLVFRRVRSSIKTQHPRAWHHIKRICGVL